MSADLLTAAQVRDLLDVDTSTVYRMANDGRLPAVRVGRQWRFPVDRIARALEAGIPPSTPEGTEVVQTAPLPRDVLAALVDLVADSLGVMMVVTDLEGRPLTHVANPCPWFEDHARDAAALDDCVQEWRIFAHSPDFEPRFRPGRHPFLCAHTFVRSGSELVAMVLAGGIAPPEAPATEGLHQLDEQGRQHVLRMLPRIASELSRLAGHVIPDVSPGP